MQDPTQALIAFWVAFFCYLQRVDGQLFVGVSTTTASYQSALQVVRVFKALAPTCITILDGIITTLRDKLVKIGCKVVYHARHVTFHLAEVAVPRGLYRAILDRIQRFASIPRGPHRYDPAPARTTQGRRKGPRCGYRPSVDKPPAWAL